MRTPVCAMLWPTTRSLARATEVHAHFFSSCGLVFTRVLDSGLASYCLAFQACERGSNYPAHIASLRDTKVLKKQITTKHDL